MTTKKLTLREKEKRYNSLEYTAATEYRAGLIKGRRLGQIENELKHAKYEVNSELAHKLWIANHRMSARTGDKREDQFWIATFKWLEDPPKTEFPRFKSEVGK